ncbi:hypothetical protein [Myxococcus sp. RHSTA-1-4]|uniref:hypothetical protein n=1 Tax=Myxococcus sp. RHSTA-1-4 TaxID=2874601 RepID=UPI001CBD861D|nr:hypothetical protein [Myxococcus sp. RHSTA-1-4]MBZ4416572.1 hypothetical protein [Myxococcus sp. RHSTA-1-4]
MQQRRALLGGVDAAEVWEHEADFQARLAQLAKTEEETARLRTRFLLWCESILFREGPGADALIQLGREEDALIKEKERRKAEPGSLRLDVLVLRSRDARGA